MQTAQLLEQLYNGKTLNKEESAVIFNAIMQGDKTRLISLLRVLLLQPLWVLKWPNTVTVAYQANRVPVMY